MRTWWKRLVGAAALLLASALPASAAISWLVAGDTDCTGLNAATGLSSTAVVSCCRNSAAGGANFCSWKANMGASWVRSITIVAGAAGTYTNPGGDQIPAAQLAKIGLQNVQSVVCANLTNGMDVVWNLTAPTTGYAYGAKIQLFAAGAGVTGGGELANATAVANVAATCLIYGY